MGLADYSEGPFFARLCSQFDVSGKCMALLSYTSLIDDCRHS